MDLSTQPLPAVDLAAWRAVSLAARERLLAPWPMVAANVVFLSLVWFLALRAPVTPEAR